MDDYSVHHCHLLHSHVYVDGSSKVFFLLAHVLALIFVTDTSLRVYVHLQVSLLDHPACCLPPRAQHHLFTSSPFRRFFRLFKPAEHSRDVQLPSDSASPHPTPPSSLGWLYPQSSMTEPGQMMKMSCAPARFRRGSRAVAFSKNEGTPAALFCFYCDCRLSCCFSCQLSIFPSVIFRPVS